MDCRSYEIVNKERVLELAERIPARDRSYLVTVVRSLARHGPRTPLAHPSPVADGEFTLRLAIGGRIRFVVIETADACKVVIVSAVIEV